MRPLCILITGSESRFSETLEPFDAYLQSVECQTIRLKVGKHDIVGTLKNAVRKTSGRRPLMIVYSGHGSIFGWERGDYLSLALTLARHKGELIIVNDTCYGFTFRHYLRLFRSPKDTGLIVSWEGEGPMYGGTIRDALTFWPEGLNIEDVIISNTYSSIEKGDVELPIQLRWGATLDHLLYPP